MNESSGQRLALVIAAPIELFCDNGDLELVPRKNPRRNGNDTGESLAAEFVALNLVET